MAVYTKNPYKVSSSDKQGFLSNSKREGRLYVAESHLKPKRKYVKSPVPGTANNTI